MKLHKILFLFACGIVSVPAFAGWQYNGYYIDDGRYNDDGSRFIIGGYGGASFVNGKIKNEMGSLQTDYYARHKCSKNKNMGFFVSIPNYKKLI